MENDPNVNIDHNTNGEGAGGAQAQQTQQTNTQTPAAPPAQQTNAQSNLRTFTQDQLDAIISRERSKAVKGLYTKDQMDEKNNTIATLTTERDTANADKAKLQAELDSYKNEKFLTTKGVPADMVEFYAFKIGKLVADDKTFEQAAEEYLKDNPPSGGDTGVRMSTGGNVGGGGSKSEHDINATMNAIIRGQK